MICIWSSWCHCHPIISCSSKIQNDLPFWCWLTQVIIGKRPLNGCNVVVDDNNSFRFLLVYNKIFNFITKLKQSDCILLFMNISKYQYKSSAIAEKADRCICLLLADRRHPYIDMGSKNGEGCCAPLGGWCWMEDYCWCLANICSIDTTEAINTFLMFLHHCADLYPAK